MLENELSPEALEYLRYLQGVRSLSVHTLKAYRRDLEAWESFLVQEGVAVLQAERAQAGGFLAQLKKSGLSSTTVNRTLSSLRGFYRFLVRKQQLSRNPFGPLRNLKQKGRLPGVLFEKEIGRLLTLPGKTFQGRRDAFILELLYSTGCRISEVTGADLSDLSSDRRILRVLGKGQKIREVFLTESARRALEEYLTLRALRFPTPDPEGQKALLVNRFGRRLHNIGLAKMLAHYVQQAGIAKGVTPHTLRHTFATHLVQEGLDLRVVQELLGHKRLSTTQVYTHLDLDRLRDVVRGAHPHG